MEKEELINTLIENSLQEDIAEGDHSTLATIDRDAYGKAVLKVKQDGILAGITVAEKIFKFMEPEAEFLPLMADGDQMKPGATAFEVRARVHTILQCERLVL